MDGRKEGFAQFVVAGGDAAKLFEFVEKAFDAIPFAIVVLVVGDLFAACADGRDDGLDAIERQTFANAIRIVTFIERRELKDVVWRKAFVEAFKLAAIVCLSRGEVQGHAAVLVNGGRVQLGRQAPTRAAQSLVETVFFGAPAAC